MMIHTFSLALGGGGARGLAHIGVIRRLEEMGMRPIAIAGTSMGSIVGALLAIGKNSHEMEKIMADMEYLSLIDPDMQGGVLGGDKVEKFLDILFEGKTFSDTLIPLQVIATDIDTGERVVIQGGKLSEAVRASISIPGVFRPKKIGKRELVDGGLTNNLPIEVLPPGRVIAISAMRDLTRKIEKSRKFLGIDIKKTIFGNSYHLLQKTIDIMLSQNESRSIRSRKDIIYIRPEFDTLDYYEFTKYKEFISSGYRASEVLLEKSEKNILISLLKKIFPYNQNT